MGTGAASSRLGLASEGTFGLATPLGVGVVATELVVLVDEDRGIVVGEVAVGHEVVTVSATVTPDDELGGILAAARVSPHHLVVVPAQGPRSFVRKGLGAGDLPYAVAICAELSTDGRARIETDLRAHLCPSRRPLIERAARGLAHRLARRCPSCRSPGWGPIGSETGVLCAWCGSDVEIVRACILGCAACPHRQLVAEGPSRADPGQCQDCNP